MACKICGESTQKEIYRGTLRSGSWGERTKEDHSVLECAHCHVRSLSDFRLNKEFYESAEYREKYNNSSSVEDYQKNHGALVATNFQLLGPAAIGGRQVADFGAAAGSFLDLCIPTAEKTIAVEPALFFHEHLRKRHQVFSYGSDLVQSGVHVNVATAFDVVEHVSDPLSFITEIHQSLSVDGQLFLLTPNFQDILNLVIPEHFALYNYRTAHLFYFCPLSIHFLLKKVGFREIVVEFHHKYDLSNFLQWLRTHQPMGKTKMDLFSASFAEQFVKEVEAGGHSSHLFVRACK